MTTDQATSMNASHLLLRLGRRRLLPAHRPKIIIEADEEQHCKSTANVVFCCVRALAGGGAQPTPFSSNIYAKQHSGLYPNTWRVVETRSTYVSTWQHASDSNTRQSARACFCASTRRSHTSTSYQLNSVSTPSDPCSKLARARMSRCAASLLVASTTFGSVVFSAGERATACQRSSTGKSCACNIFRSSTSSKPSLKHSAKSF